jgi:hypothetical protein
LGRIRELAKKIEVKRYEGKEEEAGEKVGEENQTENEEKYSAAEKKKECEREKGHRET